MDSDRPPPPPPHRTTSTSSTTSDLFICFTSRHHHHHHHPSSSAAMKTPSKSILSPNRSNPPTSLSTSLSRRLKTSRSIKGGASPAMFPSTGKKRSGAGFENPEPSSPKVTCIGQVRVKSKKKHAKRLRTLSRRHSSGGSGAGTGAGDVSFRRIDHSRDGFSKSRSLAGSFQHGCDSFGSSNQENPQRNNNPRWVHLPLTICEALRAFGSEFSCLFPCRPSCFSPAKEEKPGGGDHRRDSGSCAAVFTRWLVAFQDGGDGDGGGRREIELVVGDDDDCDDDDDGEIRRVETSRRHVFDDLEIVNDRIEGGFKDESRLSICIPPKNALLLMRCRSDPLKMEALANRLWEPTVDDDDDEEEEDQDQYFFDGQDQTPLKKFESFHQETILNQENQETHKGNQEIQETHEGNQENQETHQGNQETHKGNQEIQETLKGNQENQETHEGNQENQETHKGNQESTFFGSLFDEMEEEEIQENEMESNVEKVKVFEEQEEEMVVTRFGNGSEMVDGSKEREAAGVLERESLPECLLLMMCEPKLSMEVSKETWVSSKDFIRRHSSRKKPPPPPPPQPQPPPPPPPAVEPATSQHESKPKVSTTTTTTTMASSNKYHNTRMTAEAAATAAAAATAGVQPGRSSCSLPAPPSMAEMLEQKLVNAVGYEPFVLTRCKSEPMRTAAAKLAPDSCFWKNRKLEPLRRASFGVGAAGVGF